MNGFLLDTNFAIFGLSQPDRIPASVKRTVEKGPIYLSVLSYWEVVLKSTKGKLSVGDPRLWWMEALEKLAATPLLLRPDHIAEIPALAPIHQDPFDRALIAQAIAERLTFVSSDADVSRYASKRLNILRA